MTLFSELATAADFTTAVREIADPLTQKLNLPAVSQLGLVVPDASAASYAMVRDWGLDPAVIIDSDVARWIENGCEKTTSARYGFCYHRGFELELIEPRAGTDFYARECGGEGGIVLHHVGVRVRDLDLETARLTSRGVPLLVRGRSGAGPFRGDFSYLDTRAEFGIIVELISTRFLGLRARIPPPPLIRLVNRHLDGPLVLSPR
jgi:hypothetical protein